jgi:hypothetical protein
MHAPETIRSLNDKVAHNAELLRKEGIDSSKSADPSPVACAQPSETVSQPQGCDEQ